MFIQYISLPGAYPGFLERGFICIKVWSRFADFIIFHDNEIIWPPFYVWRIDISYARFFFYESAEKVLSYARLNCAVFNYFYMSLGQVRHTIDSPIEI